MTLNEIKQIVIEAISEVVEMNGFEVNEKIDGGTIPFESLGGFDSLNAIEVSFKVGEKIGFYNGIDPKVLGVGGEKHPDKLSIDEIANNIFNEIKQ